MFWNINGFNEIIKSTDVSSWLYKNCDICFLSETHMTVGQPFKVDRFKCINHPFSDVFAKKARGGLACMVKLDFMQFVTEINRDTPDHMILSFHGGHKVFASYIPPSDSLFYTDTCFTSIPNAFFNDDGSCVIIGGGDLNSRVGNITQKLPLMGARYRTNVDKELNAHGKLLKRICNSYNCFVLNNLGIGEVELDGDFTFFRGERKSQNDICLTNQTGLNKIKDFTIHRIGWNFSDHSPISVTVNLDLYDSSLPRMASFDILSVPEKSVRRPQKVLSKNVNWEGYNIIARNELRMLQDKVDGLVAEPNTDHLNKIVRTLSKKLYNSAKTCEVEVMKMSNAQAGDITPGMRAADEMFINYSSGLCCWNDFKEVNKLEVIETKITTRN